MGRLRNKGPVATGDLVKCLYLGSELYAKTGIVLERIHYVAAKSDHEHPDEYNCKVLFDIGERMVRGKWLEVLSKNIGKEKVYDNIST